MLRGREEAPPAGPRGGRCRRAAARTIRGGRRGADRSCDRRLAGVEDALHVEVAQAFVMAERTSLLAVLAARGTFEAGGDGKAARAEDMSLRRGRPEERHRGSAEGAGRVDQAGVAADAERGLGKKRERLADGVPRRVDALYARRGILGSGAFAVVGAADQDRREALPPERVGEPRESDGRPDLRRPLGADAEGSEGAEVADGRVDGFHPFGPGAK